MSLQEIEKLKYCLCGCGFVVSGRDRIRKGHGVYVRSLMQECECGCGQSIYMYDKVYHRIRYVHGHGPKPKRNRLKCNCLYCGVIFETIPARIKGNRGKFCSKECFDNYRRCYYEFHCLYCGKEIIVSGRDLSGRKKIKYCSSICRDKSAKGVSKQGNFAKGENHPRWTGGYKKYYGPNWREQQRLARARDIVCQRCGATKEENKAELDVHHKRAFREFGLVNYMKANDLNNLICLCHRCHTITERELKGK